MNIYGLLVAVEFIHGMSELIYEFGSFWLISGHILDELMDKSEVERKCTDLENGAQSKRKN